MTSDGKTGCNVTLPPLGETGPAIVVHVVPFSNHAR